MSTASNSQATNASWALFEGLFIVAALVAVFATFIAVSGAAPDDPTAGATPWLLGLNFLLLTVLTVLVVREYLKIRGGGNDGGLGVNESSGIMLDEDAALVGGASAGRAALVVDGLMWRALDFGTAVQC